jgi:hypothetical protein
MKNELIYDFETLSQNRLKGAVVSLAVMKYDPSRFVSVDPYKFLELVGNCRTIKFDVAEQVKKYNRTISKDTLAWWEKQGAQAQKQLRPSKADQSIDKLYQFLIDTATNTEIGKVFTRGNTFDPMFLESVLADVKQVDPFSWWKIRDTRSYIEGLSFGSDLKNTFMPPECEKDFIHHDPAHDIALDVMRMQTLIREIL